MKVFNFQKEAVEQKCWRITALQPGSVSLKSVRLVAGRLGFYSGSGHSKDFKNSIRSFRAWRSAQAEVRRVLCMCCSSCMSLNSVQSFVIDNCNGSPIENGLNNARLHPLSRTFTFFTQGLQSRDHEFCFVLVRGRTKYCLLS